MIAMDENKRGIATAISVALLLVALLFLASAVAHYSSMVGAAGTYVAQAEGAQDAFDSAAWGAKKISNAYGMRASINGSTLNVSQDLSALDEYTQAMQGWSNFLQAYGSAAQMNSSDDAILSVYAGEQNLSAKHAGGGQTQFCVNPGNGTVNNYTVILTVLGDPFVNDTGANWVSRSLPCGPGEMGLSLRAEYLSDGTFDQESGCVDAASGGELTVDSGNEIASLVAGSGGCGGPGGIDLLYEPGRNLYLTVVAELNSTPSDAELGRSIVIAQSGSAEKDGRVLLG
jgi:hypothetical protein